jgi:hypothetical protein
VFMARLIEFYVPQSFKPPRRRVSGQEPRVIEFHSAVKKSA